MKRFLIILVCAAMACGAMAQRHEQRVAGRPAPTRAGYLSRTGNSTAPRPNDRHAMAPSVAEPWATPEQVMMMVDYIKSLSFDDKKVEAAMVFVRLKPIPAEGLARIAKEMSFDDNRLEFLKRAYDYCPNRQDYLVVLDVFSFKSNEDKMIEWMKHR